VLGKAVYQFKNTNTRLQKLSNAYLYTVEQQVEKLTEAVRQCVEENNTNYQENPQLYHSTEINEHIFGTIKETMGLQSH
jgi:gas vesicle protein